MTLPASVDFSEKFAEGIKSGFSGDGMKMYDCINVQSPQTFLVSINLIELDNPLRGTVGDGMPRPPLDTPLATNEPGSPQNPGDVNPPISIPLSGLSDFLGADFDFRGTRSELYVSDSNNTGLAEMLKIKLYNGLSVVADIPTVISGASGLAVDQSDYLAMDLPAGGNDIVIASVLNSKQEVELIYEISLAGGAGTIPANASTAQIKLELLIWLPLDFVATHPDGAMIKFPEMFEKGKDLFGRSSKEDSMFNMMSRIRVEIGMNSDAFRDGTMEIVDDSYVIECPLESRAIVLDLGMEDIGYINSNYPFSPEIGIWFRHNTGPTIPRGLGVVSLGFDADIKYKL
jgi:hypothetical protein